MKGRIPAPAKALTLLDVYPVGSVYISTNATSPASLFGGTWERIKGRFLLGAGDNGDGLDYTPNTTGGEAYHILAINEMPRHDHAIATYAGEGSDGSGWSARAQNIYDENQAMYLSSSGGNEPHNNLPPYLAVYMWERTA